MCPCLSMGVSVHLYLCVIVTSGSLYLICLCICEHYRMRVPLCVSGYLFVCKTSMSLPMRHIVVMTVRLCEGVSLSNVYVCLSAGSL